MLHPLLLPSGWIFWKSPWDLGEQHSYRILHTSTEAGGYSSNRLNDFF